MTPKVIQRTMPILYRDKYRELARDVYQDIAADCPEIEGYKEEDAIQIVRDADRIYAEATKQYAEVNPFRIWLKKHEYDPQFRDDMNRMVREAIYG